MPTLQHGWEFARRCSESTPILYWHTKGVSVPLERRKAVWRRLMQKHVVADWQENVKRLAVADVVGVDWQDSPDFPHFSGNFWMARSDWLSVLPSPAEYQAMHAASFTICGETWKRMCAEMWLGSHPWHHVQSLCCRNEELWNGSNVFRYDVSVDGFAYPPLYEERDDAGTHEHCVPTRHLTTDCGPNCPSTTVATSAGRCGLTSTSTNPKPSQPRRLIWLVMYGSRHWPLARACIQSLRFAGGFTGDIHVFTDQRLPKSRHFRAVRVPPEIDWQKMCAARFTLGLTINFDDYDEAMYMDLDCLCTRPIEPLFSEMDFCRAMTEPERMGDHHSTNGALTPEERVAAKGDAICAGLVAANSVMMRNVLRQWKGTYEETPPHHFSDQHALNALIFRGLVPFKAYQWDLVAPVRCYAEHANPAIIRHYWAWSKRWMIEDWQRLRLTTPSLHVPHKVAPFIHESAVSK